MKTKEQRLAEFIKNSIATLTENECGCARFILDGAKAIYIGWLDGYDMNDDTIIKSKSQQKTYDDGTTIGWALAIGIKKRNDWYWADYEDLEPYGDNEDITLSAGMSEEDRLSLARYLLQNA